MSTRISSGETERISVYAVNASGSGVTGATIPLTLRRSLDGYYWNGSAFQSGATSVNMTETDSSNFAGFYHYDFTAPDGGGDYDVTLLANTATASVVNDPWTGSFKVGGTQDSIEKIRKYVSNKVTISGSTYSVKEDDGTTEFETGTITQTERTPS